MVSSTSIQATCPTPASTEVLPARAASSRDAVASRLLAALAGRTSVLAGVGQVAWIDVDDTIKAMHGYAQQGVAYGYSKVKGLNAQLAVLSTPLAAPVVAGVRLRKGNVASAHGAPKLIADAVATARRCGAGELVTVRADSAYYQRPVVAAARAAGARFSITARMNPQITKAIAGIDDQAWTAIKYPKAVFDELAGGWVSDAAVAEVPVFTAFTSRPKAQQVTARLIVRRVKRLNSAASETHPPASSSKTALGYLIAVHAWSSMPAIALVICGFIRAVIENRAPAARAAATTGRW